MPSCKILEFYCGEIARDTVRRDGSRKLENGDQVEKSCIKGSKRPSQILTLERKEDELLHQGS